MAYDIPSISDLEAIQLLNKHYAEVVTSKKDGIASGSDITQTTNPITGVTRRTLYKILDDMDDTFLERLLKMAFTPVGTFTAGATLTDARQTLLWEVSQGGDGHYYSWSGSFGTSGKVVAAGSSPSPIAAGSWVDRTDDSLRDEIRETVFQNMKRLAAEAGFNLVDGSFEEGAVISGWPDVVWSQTDGKYYQWYLDEAKTIAAGSTPATSGGIGAGAWVDRTDATLRSDINIVQKCFACVADMVADTALTVGKIVETLGYHNDWAATSDTPKGGNRYEIVAGGTGTADGGAFINLSNGLQAKGLFVNGTVNICQYGAKGDGVTDDTACLAGAITMATGTTLYDSKCIIFPSGKYIISSGFVVKPFISFKSDGVVRIQYTGTGDFLTVRYSANSDTLAATDGLSQNANNTHNIFDGSNGAFIIAGSGKLNGQRALVFGNVSDTSSATRHTAWLGMSNVFIDSFQNAFYFVPVNVFIMRFYNVTCSGCDTIINTPISANTNSGEQINWFGCAFHNSNRIMTLGCQMNMEFHGCSFDYGTGATSAIYVTRDYQTIRIIGGWIEAPNSEGYRFIESATGVAANRRHVSLDSVYIMPRDKKQCLLFSGPMSLTLTNNTFVVNRFTNYPSSSSGDNHLLCDSSVVISECSGNRYFDQMVSIGTDNAINRNSDFEIDADGTIASTAAPNTITGWTHNGGAGSSTVMVDTTHKNTGSKSLKINSDGTFINITSAKFQILGNSLFANLAIYSPNDASVSVTLKVNFYTYEGTLISTSQVVTSYTDFPSSFVTLKDGVFANVPSGAFYATYNIIVGSYSSAVWIDNAIAEFV